MKIVSVTARVCNAEMRNWVFVRVETDEPGLIGWGEATLELKTRAVIGADRDIEPMLVGEDPREHRALLPGDEPPRLLAHGHHRHVGDLAASRSRSGTFWESISACRSGGCSAASRPRQPAHLHPSRPRRHARRLRDRARRPRSSSMRGASPRRATTRCKIVCIPYTPLRDADTRRRQGRAHGRRPARCGRAGHRHHGRFPRPARPRCNAALDYIDAHCADAPHHVRRGAGAAGGRRWAGARSPRRSPVPIASGERLVGRREFEPSSGRAPSTSPSPTSAIPAAFWESKKIAAMAETAGDRRRAAQPARADRRRRRAAFRHLDAQRHHPGGDVGRGALVRRGRRTGRSNASPAAGTCRESPASASRSTKPSSPRIPSSRRFCTPRTRCCRRHGGRLVSAMAGRLAGKRAIVTGAGQGIGEAIARIFAARGRQGASSPRSTRDRRTPSPTRSRRLAARPRSSRRT